MKTQIAQILNVQENQVLEVREWAFVYWVKVAGRRPTLLSKKALGMTTEQRIEKVIESIKEDGYEANLWEKYGKRRIYIGKDNGVRVNGYGYIDINNNFSIEIPQQKAAYLVAWHAVRNAA